jgi:Fic family protein
MNLSSTIKQIDSLKKEADALKPVKPEFEQKFWDKYRLEFNYNSNHIEGNTLTYGHTQLLLLFDKVGGDYTLRELEEMKAHDVALRFVKEAALDPQHILTEKFIKEINQTILVRQYFKEAITEDGQPTRRLIEPGQYKKHSNSVRLENGEIFRYASPEETPAQMGDFIEWVRKEEENKELHPVQLAALVHYRFVRIHPFDDSNGRTSRLLMNYFLMRYGYAPLVIESADKKNYLTALNRADVGDIEAFVQYISRLAIKWQSKYVKAIKGEEIEDDDDLKKDIALLKREVGQKKQFKILSPDIFQSIIDTVVFPFVKILVENLSEFDPLFSNKDVYLGTDTIKIPLHFSDQVAKLIIEQKRQLSTSTVIEFLYNHKDLRIAKKPGGNIQIVTIFSFDKYSYKIQTNLKNLLVEKDYDQVLSIEEMTKIARDLTKYELEIIKGLK